MGGRRAETIGERLAADTAIIRTLPATPLEPCDKRAARVSSTAWSRTMAHGFHDVLVKGFVDEVVILCGGEEIARHPRSYGQGVFVFDPLHYLALIEMKPNALDQAAALQGWDLPEGFQHLRHLLEARMGNRGKREFIQILRLMEAAPKEVVANAVNDPARRDRLRRGQADRSGSHREAPGAARSGGLSVSAANERQDDVSRRLRRACVREPRMSKKVDKPVAAETMPSGTTGGTPQILLAHHLKQLRLPTILREYDKVAREAAREGIDHRLSAAIGRTRTHRSRAADRRTTHSRRAFRR